MHSLVPGVRFGWTTMAVRGKQGVTRAPGHDLGGESDRIEAPPRLCRFISPLVGWLRPLPSASTLFRLSVAPPLCGCCAAAAAQGHGVLVGMWRTPMYIPVKRAPARNVVSCCGSCRSFHATPETVCVSCVMLRNATRSDRSNVARCQATGRLCLRFYTAWLARGTACSR